MKAKINNIDWFIYFYSFVSVYGSLGLNPGFMHVGEAFTIESHSQLLICVLESRMPLHYYKYNKQNI